MHDTGHFFEKNAILSFNFGETFYSKLVLTLHNLGFLLLYLKVFVRVRVVVIDLGLDLPQLSFVDLFLLFLPFIGQELVADRNSPVHFIY